MIYNYPTIKNVCDSEETSLYKHLVRRFQIDYESKYLFYLHFWFKIKKIEINIFINKFFIFL